MTHHEVEAHTNRVLITRARHVVVVADASKIRRVAFARICGLDQVDELITDASAPEEALAPLKAAGIAVTVV